MSVMVPMPPISSRGGGAGRGSAFALCAKAWSNIVENVIHDFAHFRVIVVLRQILKGLNFFKKLLFYTGTWNINPFVPAFDEMVLKHRFALVHCVDKRRNYHAQRENFFFRSNFCISHFLPVLLRIVSSSRRDKS